MSFTFSVPEVKAYEVGKEKPLASAPSSKLSNEVHPLWAVERIEEHTWEEWIYTSYLETWAPPRSFPNIATRFGAPPATVARLDRRYGYSKADLEKLFAEAVQRGEVDIDDLMKKLKGGQTGGEGNEEEEGSEGEVGEIEDSEEERTEEAEDDEEGMAEERDDSVEAEDEDVEEANEEESGEGSQKEQEIFTFQPKHYDRLKPAFQLASRFLEISTAFFWKVATAEVGTHATSKRPLLLDCQPPTVEQTVALRELFHSLANRMKVFFVYPDEGPLGAHGMTTPHPPDPAYLAKYIQVKRELFQEMGEALTDPQEPFDAHAWPICTRLNRGMTRFFLTPTDEEWSSEEHVNHSTKRRAWFMLAYTLVHELAHVVNLAVRDERYHFINVEALPEEQRAQRAGHAEPFFDLNQARLYDSSELGDAWENWFFGGRMSMAAMLTGEQEEANNREEGLLYWIRHHWESTVDEELRLMVQEDDAYWSITDRSLGVFFDDGAWEVNGAGSERAALPYVELTPARAILGCTEDLEDLDDVWQQHAHRRSRMSFEPSRAFNGGSV